MNGPFRQLRRLERVVILSAAGVRRFELVVSPSLFFGSYSLLVFNNHRLVYRVCYRGVMIVANERLLLLFDDVQFDLWDQNFFSL